MLIKFTHGLGDAVQFTIVLRHLRQLRPSWNIDVMALRGKHSAFQGGCRRVFHDQESPPNECDYDRCYDLPWHEQNRPCSEFPSTKVSRCLTKEFGLQPDPALFTYEIAIGDDARRVAAAYLQSICPDSPAVNGRFPVLLLHYEGNTSADNKNLSHDTAEAICQTAIDVGLVPVVLVPLTKFLPSCWS